MLDTTDTIDVLADMRLGRKPRDLAKASADFDLRRALARVIEVYGKPEAQARVVEVLAEVAGE